MLQGLFVAAAGMGLVFLSLIVLLFVIMGLDRLFPVKKPVAEAEALPEVAEAEARPEAMPAIDGGIVAAISVAMARLSPESLPTERRGASKEKVAAISAALAHLPEGVAAGEGWGAGASRAVAAAISVALAHMPTALSVMKGEVARPKAVSRASRSSAWKNLGRQQLMLRGERRRW